MTDEHVHDDSCMMITAAFENKGEQGKLAYRFTFGDAVEIKVLIDRDDGHLMEAMNAVADTFGDLFKQAIRIHTRQMMLENIADELLKDFLNQDRADKARQN